MSVSSTLWLSHLLLVARPSYCSSSSSFLHATRRRIMSSTNNKKRGSSSSSYSSRAAASSKPLAAFFQPASSKKSARQQEDSPSDNPSSSSSAQQEGTNKKPSRTYKLFCDLDGVLVDFEAGASRLLHGRTPDQVPASRLWSSIHAAPHFFRDLPWTKDGEALWDILRTQHVGNDLHPITILTGVSQRSGTVVQDKYLWCQRELCVETHLVDMTGPPGTGRQHLPANSGTQRKPHVVNVVTCWSRNKHCESKPGHVLIDDRDKLRADWEKAGGIFIHHTDTPSTVQRLRCLGIVPPEESAPSPSSLPSSSSSSNQPSCPATGNDSSRTSADTSSNTAPILETLSSAGTVENDAKEEH